MRRFTSLVVLVLAITGSLLAGSGASAEPNPVEEAVARVMGPGHCC